MIADRREPSRHHRAAARRSGCASHAPTHLLTHPTHALTYSLTYHTPARLTGCVSASFSRCKSLWPVGIGRVRVAARESRALVSSRPGTAESFVRDAILTEESHPPAFTHRTAMN